jgi:hypothetical protein
MVTVIVREEDGGHVQPFRAHVFDDGRLKFSGIDEHGFLGLVAPEDEGIDLANRHLDFQKKGFETH